MIVVTYSKPGRDNRIIGEFDSLEDACAAAVQAGGKYDDNKTERFEQRRSKDMCWSVESNSGHGIWFERAED